MINGTRPEGIEVKEYVNVGDPPPPAEQIETVKSSITLIYVGCPMIYLFTVRFVGGAITILVVVSTDGPVNDLHLY